MPRYRNSLNCDNEEGDPLISRRTFLAMLGVGAVAAVGGVLAMAVGGFLYPNAMKIPPSLFPIGRPEEVLGTEGKLFNPKQKVFIESRGGKVRVQTAVCTHLGCTVNLAETGYACPCHGSTYDLEGFNTGGPAPKPLVYFKVFKGASGELLVDKSRPIHNPKEAWYSPVSGA
jgi:cytochrome b6-f complex iron-sulfur subunit